MSPSDKLVSGTGGRNRLVSRVVFFGLVVLGSSWLCAGCAGGSALSVADPNDRWRSIISQGPLRVEDGLYRGGLFALRRDGRQQEWVRCPLEGAYRFERLAPRSVEVRIGDVDMLEQTFFAGDEGLRARVLAGGVIHVSYVASGRFVLDIDAPGAVSVVCTGSTHHVRSIVVGAYRVTIAGFSESDVSSGDVQVMTRGNLERCETGQEPSRGCFIPVAYEFVANSGDDSLLDSGAKGIEFAPSETTLPRPF